MEAIVTDMSEKIRRYFKFSANEIRDLAITIVIISFIFSFKEWGPGKVFDIAVGLVNWFNAAIIVTLSILVREAAHRLAGLSVGFKVEFKMWIYGLLIGLVLVFISKGELLFLVPGGIFLHIIPKHRLGYFRAGLNLLAVSFISLAAPLANLLLAMFFKIMMAFPFNQVMIEKAMTVNLLLAVFSMLPFPPLDGSRIFYESRGKYVFLTGAIVFVAIFLKLVERIWIALLGSIAIAILLWVGFYIFFERQTQ